ncbi:alkylglycerol monooxygenase isoform X3 [Macaca fascicularis]|uniref:alkylglycerol monooxygenase isoform X4 n=1 Tax=Macaca mulatta TaxID=9544 RepID=UPI0005F56ED7|nr:alkylglycerol monooxygenase isoform X6 [Macaca nemestrina]XP_028701828.1 alkylglycerol monooxygenase isoform X4 [Macaca mulatta]
MKNPEAQQDVSFSQGFRMLFYTMKPNETSFQTLEEVPDYVKKATPFFISLMLLELVVSWIHKGKSPGRLDDALTSISAGVLSRLPSLFFRSIELTSYIYIWENYRLFSLPWDSPWTWYLTFFGVDFGYYWFHRMAHEVNIMWAGHQTHHSSEDYNLSTALRQSVLQLYTSWIFYSPLALFIPPSVYAVHLQFNLLYQFWIHTEVINNLGPLELILNTPSHHRVHHGRNRYCIDKNFAGVLIIWDRIFGTFEAENEKVVYGLTHPINTFEPIRVQVTGKDVPFSSSASQLLKIYTVVQFALMLVFYEETFADAAALSQVTLLLRVCFIILTLTSIGFLLDQRPKAAFMETLRCLMFLMLYRFGHLKPVVPSLSSAFESYSVISEIGLQAKEKFGELLSLRDCLTAGNHPKVD